MSGNDNKEIKNRTAYFNKVVQNMDAKDLSKNIKINEFEKLSNEIEEINYRSDEYFNGDDLLDWLDWLELVENSDLHRALKSLSIEELTLISYTFYKEKTQREVARIYKVSHQFIRSKIHKIICKIKKHLLNK